MNRVKVLADDIEYRGFHTILKNMDDCAASLNFRFWPDSDMLAASVGYISESDDTRAFQDIEAAPLREG